MTVEGLEVFSVESRNFETKMSHFRGAELTSQKLIDRRITFLRLRCRCATVAQVIKQMCDEDPSLNPLALRKDWNRREKWMPTLVRLNDPTLAEMLVQGWEEIEHAAWVAHQKAKSPSNIIGAVNVLISAHTRYGEFLQSIGAVKKVPTDIRQTISSETPWLLDPAIKATYEAMVKQQQAEAEALKDAADKVCADAQAS